MGISTALLASGATHVIMQRVSSSWPWYVIRGSGFTAAGLLILLMLSGIGQVTGILYRFVEPIKAWAVHKAMAIALLLAIAVHGSFLLLDKFLPFSLGQILIPLNSTYNNNTMLWGLPLKALAVAFGIIAMYIIMIVVASSLGWIDTKTRRWRNLHYLNYVVILLVFLHALYAGSDLRYGIFREAWTAMFFVLLLAVFVRLWRVKVVMRKSGGK